MLAVARASGAIELSHPVTGELLGAIPSAAAANSKHNGSSGAAADAGAARLAGLHLVWPTSSSSEGPASSSLPAVLSVTRGGVARLHAYRPSSAADAAGEQQQNGDSSDGWHEERRWATPPDVCCTAYDAAAPSSASASDGAAGSGWGGTLAVGCQGTELRLYDVATGQLAWAAKGGKPNKVGLVDKPWNTALAFLPRSLPASGQDAGGGGGSGSQAGGGGTGTGAGAAAPACSARLLVGTGYHRLRLYDAAAGKRPQMDISWGEARITALAVEGDGRRAWVANGAGQVEVLDLLTRRFAGGIKGIAGSVRALALHPAAPLLASVGLDRHLRLHSTATRALCAKAYLKTQLSSAAFCPTDASMLPPPPAAGKQWRRGDGEEGEAEEQGSEEEADEERAAPRGGSGRRRRREGREEGQHNRKKTKSRRRQDGGGDSD
eukprot:scaffold5.g645.t1